MYRAIAAACVLAASAVAAQAGDYTDPACADVFNKPIKVLTENGIHTTLYPNTAKLGCDPQLILEGSGETFSRKPSKPEGGDDQGGQGSGSEAS